MLTNERGQVLESAVLFRLTTLFQRLQCQMSCSTLKRGLPGTPNMRSSIFCSTRFRITGQSTPRAPSNATRLIQRCPNLSYHQTGPGATGIHKSCGIRPLLVRCAHANTTLLVVCVSTPRQRNKIPPTVKKRAPGSAHSLFVAARYFSPSSARLSCSTFTRGSPKTPSWRPSMCRSTRPPTVSRSSLRAFATRST